MLTSEDREALLRRDGVPPYCEESSATLFATVERIIRRHLAEEVRDLCNEAAEDVEHWGGYAGDYFQEKWGWMEDVQRWRDRATKAEKGEA